MLDAAWISRNHVLVSIGLFVLSVALGLLIVADADLLLLAVAATVMLPVVLRVPQAAAVGLIAFALTQPLLLRLVPDTSALSVWLRRSDEFLLVAALPLAFLQYHAAGLRFVPWRSVICLAGVFVLGAAGSFLRQPPWDLAILDAFLLGKAFLFAFIAASLCPTRRQLEWLFRALVAFGLAAGAFGVLEVLVPGRVRAMLPLASAGYRHGRACLVSILQNEGQAGWFFAFLAAASYAFFLVYRRRGYLGLFGLFSTFAFLTLRRKPMLGLLAVLIVSLLVSRQYSERWKRVVVLGLAAALPLILFGDVLAPIFLEGYEVYIAPRDPMVIARNAMYIASVQIAVDHFPIGVGFGLFGGFTSQMSYSPVYAEYGLSKTWGLTPQYSGYATDAYWPHIIGQFGVLGWALFMGALAYLWAVPLRIVRSKADPWRRAVCLAALFTFVEALVESMVAPIFETTLSAFFVFGLAGIALRVATAPIQGSPSGS